LCEEAVSFSLSTFTLDIDGKPTLVLRAKWQADADEICRAWVQAHWDELTREGPYGTELPPAVRLRMARATEKAAYETNAHSALLFYESPFSGDSSKRRQRRRGPQHPKVALDGWTNPHNRFLITDKSQKLCLSCNSGPKTNGPTDVGMNFSPCRIITSPTETFRFYALGEIQCAKRSFF
jgi:hypothetical protein